MDIVYFKVTPQSHLILGYIVDLIKLQQQNQKKKKRNMYKFQQRNI